MICFDEVSTISKSALKFYDPVHQKIFEAIENLISKGMLANPYNFKKLF